MTSACGSSLAEDVINGSENADGTDIAPSAETLNLEGIWTFSFEDAGQMTAVLYQSESSIWGAAKSEKPEPWNGVLTGSIYGDRIEISTLSATGDVLTVTGMQGTATGETVKGSFFQIDGLGETASGAFAGMRTSADAAGYAPVAAAQSYSSALVTAASSEIPQSSETEVQPKTKTVDETTGGYTDVHQLSAGINPKILGYAAPVTGKR
ncbi:MAG TPA: hypothetical protein HA349_00050 [Methanotrichaceae archaeon]|nr:hypothetical protein [Methanotrichaceae archaeon]